MPTASTEKTTDAPQAQAPKQADKKVGEKRNETGPSRARGGAGRGGPRGGSSGGRKGRGRRQNREERAKPEFDHTVLDIRRVTRVVSGGRRFSFRVTLVAGDRKGRIGVGMGKAGDTPLAIEKAFRDAKRKMITVQTTKEMSIPCETEAKYSASQVLMMPSPGKGIIAGGAVRPVVELAGLHDISAKLLSRSKNSLNNARAAIEALKKLPAVKKAEKKADKKEEKETA
ncbi:MAG: 30S ribosomal protein S5 [Candidatus Paceibacterota bacterium]